MDVVAVGIGTALLDDPRLTARPPGPRVPARLVLDRTARLPLTSRLVTTAREAPVWVAVTDQAPLERRDALAAAGCEILAFSGTDRVPVPALLDALGARGATHLLVEGGGMILGSFFDAGEVDAVDVFIAPAIEGGSKSPGPVLGTGLQRMTDLPRLDHVRMSNVDGDIRLQGTVRRAWATGDDSA
jgi:diaminohydroxyphosphoribosylaminopyrimidine deaminase/5-amino-6-(5-phosphoribosylamino)uracil reductase